MLAAVRYHIRRAFHGLDAEHGPPAGYAHDTRRLSRKVRAYYLRTADYSRKRRSSSMRESTFTAPAAQIGFPPKVEPCEPGV